MLRWRRSLDQTAVQEGSGDREEHDDPDHYVKAGEQVGHPQVPGYKSPRQVHGGGKRRGPGKGFYPVRHRGDRKKGSAEEVKGRRYHGERERQNVNIRRERGEDET